MAIDLSTEHREFARFVSERLNGSTMSLEESLAAFRQHPRELIDLREKLRVAEEQSARGESRPFDADETKRSVRERLAEHGITD